jgi:DNA-binding LytR/AlgR family response regulator
MLTRGKVRTEMAAVQTKDGPGNQLRYPITQKAVDSRESAECRALLCPGVTISTKQALTGGNPPTAPVPADALLAVKDPDRDKIRLLSRREIAAVLRRQRRTWVDTLREEFPTYYPLTDLARWLGEDPFIQLARNAVINLRAIEHITHYGDRLYQVRLCDRLGTRITASRTGAVRLAATLKAATLEK